MKNNTNMLVGFVLLVIGLTGILFTPSIHQPMTGIMRAMTDAQFPPGLTATTLPQYGSREVSLLTQYCTQCHALPGPGMHTSDDWPQVIGRMNQYMQTMHSFHVQKPSSDEAQAILDYLQSHAQAAMEKSQYPDLVTPEGIAFLQTCSRCHSTPDPKQHTAEEWDAVVQRMLHNMKLMRKEIPDAARVEKVTAFLKKHAKT